MGKLQPGMVAGFVAAVVIALAGQGALAAAGIDTAGLSDATMCDNAFPSLRWRYYNPGDYDQNGEVNLGDMLPLAQHLGVDARGKGPATIESVLDGDGNGEINIADLTVIGKNLKRSALGGFKVYASPASVTDPALPGAFQLGSVAFSSTASNPRMERLVFELTLAGADPATAWDYYYWKSSDGLGVESPTAYRFLVPVPPASGGGILRPLYAAGQHQLEWLYYNLGDGNQDGLVSDADLTAMGRHYHETLSLPDGLGSLLVLLDCQADGEININDVPVLGGLWGRRVLGYNVYHAAGLGQAPAGLEASLFAPLGTVAIASGGGDPDRLSYSFVLPATPDPGYYWVRPFGPGGIEGAASTPVQVP
jgi:hypothetical protein